MPPKPSAGILPYRYRDGKTEFFLVHPGGPFWKHKDLGAWSIAKGELDEVEDLLRAAKREFEEETGISIKDFNDFLDLGQTKMKSGKLISAFALLFDFDETAVVSNTFDLEWPPKSGKIIQVPEVDRGAWFDFDTAHSKINPAQQVFLERLVNLFRDCER